jgi:hypothetical protein
MNTKDNLKKTSIIIVTIFWVNLGCIQLISATEAHAETLRPTLFVDYAGKSNSAENAYDDDNETSYADILTNTDAFPSIVFHTWETPSGTYDSIMLYITRSSEGNGDDKWGIKYSTDAGNTWSTLEAMSPYYTIPKGSVSTPLDPSQDLSKLQVRIDTDKKKKADNGLLQIYDIRTEGVLQQVSTPSIEQSAYRFFENSASVDFYARDNTTSGVDEANAIAIDDTYMYVVGFEPGKWRIEKRRLDTGLLEESFGEDGNGAAYSEVTGEAKTIAVDDMYMYIAGDDYSAGNYNWRIEKRLLADGSLDENFGSNGVIIRSPSNENESSRAIVIDDNYMYIAGSDRANGQTDAQWRIEKRNLSDGTLIDAITENPSTDDDIPYAIAIDDSYMYVSGYDRIPGSSNKPGKGNGRKTVSNAQWRIEKRSLADLSLVLSVTENPTDDTDVAKAVAIDGEHLYVVGSQELGFFDTAWRIEKRYLDNLSLCSDFGNNGVIVEDFGYDDQPESIAIDANNMYIAGFSADIGGGGDTAWHIEKRSLINGSLEYEIMNDLNRDNNDRAYAIAIDAGFMYVAGYINPWLADWRVSKRELSDGSLDILELISPTELQNTSVNMADGGQFRLRMLLHIGDNPLARSAQQFKLQYGVSDSPGECGSCSYHDVTDNTTIAFNDNPIASDGTALTLLGSAEDPSHFGHTIYNQTYEEFNNFTNSESEINTGEDGMWDFSLSVVGALVEDIYCLRIVKNDGTLLDSYNVYPEVTVVAP